MKNREVYESFYKETEGIKVDDAFFETNKLDADAYYIGEKRIPNGAIVKNNNTGDTLKIVDAIETNNQFGYGTYLYRFEGRTDTGFGLYKKEITVISYVS